MISIHALREEGDGFRADMERIKRISIHALREEGDRAAPKPSRHRSNFYPRPPRGGRRLLVIRGGLVALFLSTPSARRATAV